jgi:exodeoxyribonuclease-3
MPKNNVKKDFPNKIICWNVNGIRALTKKGAFDWLVQQGADIVCLQETKAHPEQLAEEIRNPTGYKSYFDHSKEKKGYSGVVIYTKKEIDMMVDEFYIKPATLPESKTEVAKGVKANAKAGEKKAKGIEDLRKGGLIDIEGRFIQTDFPSFTLINCYFPNGGGAPERLEYKLRFFDSFISYVKKLMASGREVVVCGDFNIVHKEADSARFKENQGNIGFLPEERARMDGLVDIGLVDAFRRFYPDLANAFTWWDMKSFARERNIGWRIDTFFVTKGLVDNLKDIKIEADVYGSDHCPVVLYFK